VAVAQGLIFLLLGLTLPIDLSLAGAVQLVLLLVVAAAALTSLGTFFAWKTDSTQGFHSVMNLVLMPLWLLSGGFSGPGGLEEQVRALGTARGDAAQRSATRWQCAVARAGGRISGRLGAGVANELAGNRYVCRRCIWFGRVDQPRADCRRFAVNRTGFFISFGLFVASGALMTALGYYALTGVANTPRQQPNAT
jgi:hypothetical protein